ncbi:MAG: glycine betaine ABC transporter substrate-binding protein [Lacrimispora sp.]|uniref:glycine betaine ABC transporter substrate-binding protein n=1 Tax=Lacrimispora sp. TaxID=2719234 RepID=UPI0039E6CC70
MGKKIIGTILALSIAAVGLYGCRRLRIEEPERNIKLTYEDWDEGIALTSLAAAVMEDRMGYRVDMIMEDADAAFASLAAGDTDACLNVRLPITHKSQVEQYGSDMIDLGISYESEERVHKYVRKGFATDMPEVALFLKNFKMNEAELKDFMESMKEDGREPLESARIWIKLNTELINGWISG